MPDESPTAAERRLQSWIRDYGQAGGTFVDDLSAVLRLVEVQRNWIAAVKRNNPGQEGSAYQ